ncbi:uncharacterized protein B0T15DRAFT_396829, partial [Chaetomium strumarium]
PEPDTMDRTDNISETPDVGEERGSSSPELSLEVILPEPLRQEIASWCASRLAASSLDIEQVYVELRHLEAKEKLVVAQDGCFGSVSAAWTREKMKQMIARGFDIRRCLLRSAALELSRDKLQPITIVDLPLDILRIIFNEFHYDRVFSDSRSSLDIADVICQRPHIACGVHGIQVCLAYRPKEYADSLVRYTTSRLTNLSLYVRLRYDLCAVDGGDTSLLQEEADSWLKLSADWEDYCREFDGGGASREVPEGYLTPYREMLRQGYAEFRRLHEEQRRLLSDGSFANALAAAIAQLPNAHCLSFVDDVERHADLEGSLLNDAGRFSRMMQAQPQWREIDDDEQGGSPVDMESIQHRPALVPDEDKLHLDHYVGAILSNCGKQLRYLHVDLSNLGIRTNAFRAEHENCSYAGPFLARLQEMPRIRNLSLYGSELGLWRCIEETSIPQDVGRYMRGELERNPLRPYTDS